MWRRFEIPDITMLMYCKFSSTLKKWCLIGFIPCLSACANLAPGMHIDTKYVSSTPAQGSIKPIIKSITSDLIQTEKAIKALQPTQDLSIFYRNPKSYLIGNGDLLSILVWDHPELTIATAAAQALAASAIPGAQTPAGFVVDQDGIVQFPYVGPVKLAGLTELQARSLLSSLLLKSIKKPDITLRVQAFRSKRIYVDGEVKTPGNLTIDDVPMTLLEALSRAGGMLPTADQSNINISRAGVVYQINLPLLLQHGINPAILLLAQGDVVRVISRDENKIYVLGEVNLPRALPMNNGRLTLTQALGEAGGLNQTSAAAKKVYVIRNVASSEPLVYNLDAESPISMALADNFELNPRDVVYVDASGLARYNRMISLIIPSSAAVVSTVSGLK